MADVINGKFYVAGGLRGPHGCCDSDVAVLEVYDPTADTWTTKASMPQPRSAGGAAVVNGKLYTVGGYRYSQGADVATLEVYDPATDSWAVKTPMPTARRWPSVEAINGLVYVIGGTRNDLTDFGAVEVYNPSTDTWTTKASMPTPRSAMASAIINGKIYVVGGITNTLATLGALEVYDPVSDTWATKSPLAQARAYVSGANINGNFYVVTGNLDGTFGSISLALNVYDPAADTWASSIPIPTGRTRLGEIGVINGKIYVAGGWSASTDNIDVLEVFDPSGLPTNGQNFVSTGSMNLARAWHQATQLNNGKVLVTGGNTPEGITATAEVYDPSAGTWRYTLHPMNQARYSHTATLLQNGKVLIAGGVDAGNLNSLSSAEVFDPATETFTLTGSMANVRHGFQAVRLNDGRVLAVSGRSTVTLYVTPTNEIYDPASGTWSTAPNLAAGVTQHTVTLLPSGQVLIAGGYDGFTPTAYNFVSRYMPSTNTLVSMSPLLSQRRTHGAALLLDGKVAIIAGIDPSSSVNSTEVYDPALVPNGQSVAGLNLNQARADYFTTTILENDDVLVIGGNQSGNGCCFVATLATAEVRDHITGMWITAGSMSTPRTLHTATLLPDGRVLVAGGDIQSGLLSSAELWKPVACATSLPDLVSWWPGNGNPNDIRGNNHGTQQNGATFASGKIGQGLNLDGVDDYIEVPHNPNLDPGTGSFTIDAWVKDLATTGTKAIVSKYECGGTCISNMSNSLYSLAITNGIPNFNVRDTDQGGPLDPLNNGGRFLTGTGSIGDGNFHHLAGVRDQIAGQLLLYVDGVLNASAPLNPGATGAIKDDDGEPDPFLIGAIASPESGVRRQFFPGVIDEVQFFNRALSSTEILAIAGGAAICNQIIANAGPDQNVRVGASVALNGSNSSAPTAPAYSWSFMGKPNGSTATLSSANTVSPTFTPDKEGAYTLKLVVSAGGQSASDTVRVQAVAQNCNSSSLSVHPVSLTMGNNQIRIINGFGGNRNYSWSLVTNVSGGSVSATLGPSATYTSGNNMGQDVIRMTDPWCGAKDLLVTVGAPEVGQLIVPPTVFQGDGLNVSATFFQPIGQLTSRSDGNLAFANAAMAVSETKACVYKDFRSPPIKC